MPRAPKQCGRYGCPELVTGVPYCADHLAEVRRTNRSPSSLAAEREHAERERRRAHVAAWVRSNGWVCPGWQRDAHPSHDLTAAHVTAVARGGGDGPLGVLCRSCNSRQGVRST